MTPRAVEDYSYSCFDDLEDVRFGTTKQKGGQVPVKCLYGLLIMPFIFAAGLLPAQDRFAAIEPNATDHVFLRMDGRGVTQGSGPGGVVNAQFHKDLRTLKKDGPWEQFRLMRLRGEGDVVAIESIAFPHVFLRMDGRGVTQGPNSGGVVNAVFHRDYEEVRKDGALEQFRLIHLGGQGDVFAIESVAFPHLYLRLEGIDVTHFTGSGGGVVKAKYRRDMEEIRRDGAWEQFRLYTAN